MSSDSVSEFACAAQHRGLDGVTCDRKRWHAGNHRGTDGRSLLEWADPPAPTEPLPELAMLRPQLEVGRLEAGHLDPVTFPDEPDRRPLHPAGWPPALAWAVFVALVTLWPAVLVLAYRAAF